MRNHPYGLANMRPGLTNPTLAVPERTKCYHIMAPTSRLLATSMAQRYDRQFTDIVPLIWMICCESISREPAEERANSIVRLRWLASLVTGSLESSGRELEIHFWKAPERGELVAHKALCASGNCHRSRADFAET